jgi:DNA repair photolyase
MIISASRRTDIPAFYHEWFMNRIKAGFCKVPNPLNTHQVSEVSLNPEDVDAIVFWTKNPKPLIPNLSELNSRGFKYYFQFTLNDYPRALEPNLPAFIKRLEVFKDLSQLIGPSLVVWRYDPIIISNITSSEFHIEKFTSIAEELKGFTKRVMISIVDFYKKTDRRLSQLEREEGYTFQRNVENDESTISLLKEIARIAKKNDMEVHTCAEERDYSLIGISPGRCIDERIIAKMTGRSMKYKKDPYQRESCLCMFSKDIGSNDTCMHGCLYCYATTNSEVAQRRYTEHNSLSPVLWGKIPDQLEADKESSQKRLFK